MTNLVFSGTSAINLLTHTGTLNSVIRPMDNTVGTVQSNYLVGGKLRVLYWTKSDI